MEYVPIPAIAADGVAKPIPQGHAAAKIVVALSHAAAKHSMSGNARFRESVSTNAVAARQSTDDTK